MNLRRTYSKLITAHLKRDVNGNGYWLVSDGEHSQRVKLLSSEQGSLIALAQFVSDKWGKGVEAYEVVQANIQTKDKFVGYAYSVFC
jgi:hypothetical protein